MYASSWRRNFCDQGEGYGLLRSESPSRMRQAPLQLLPPLTDVRPLAKALGLEVDDILLTPAPRPAHTGATHLLVRVRDAGAVDRAAPIHESLLAVLRAAGAEGCYIYVRLTPEPELSGSGVVMFRGRLQSP